MIELPIDLFQEDITRSVEALNASKTQGKPWDRVTTSPLGIAIKRVIPSARFEDARVVIKGKTFIARDSSCMSFHMEVHKAIQIEKSKNVSEGKPEWPVSAPNVVRYVRDNWSFPLRIFIKEKVVG